VGYLMMRFSHRAIRRRADLPPFREYLRVARPWEIAVMLGVFAAFAASFLAPWALTGSPLSGLLGFIAFGVLWSVVAVPVLVVLAIRHPEPLGTHWDGKGWKYGS
jgi:hypothetical protein